MHYQCYQMYKEALGHYSTKSTLFLHVKALAVNFTPQIIASSRHYLHPWRPLALNLLSTKNKYFLKTFRDSPWTPLSLSTLTFMFFLSDCSISNLSIKSKSGSAVYQHITSHARLIESFLTQALVECETNKTEYSFPNETYPVVGHKWWFLCILSLVCCS